MPQGDEKETDAAPSEWLWLGFVTCGWVASACVSLSVLGQHVVSGQGSK